MWFFFEFSFLTGHCVYPIISHKDDGCMHFNLQRRKYAHKAPPQLVNIQFFVVTDKRFFFIDMSKKTNDYES